MILAFSALAVFVLADPFPAAPPAMPSELTATGAGMNAVGQNKVDDE
jgi:hypothetical protein